MTYAKRFRNLALITMPWVLLQWGCVISGEEAQTLASNGIRDFVTSFFQTGLGNILNTVF